MIQGLHAVCQMAQLRGVSPNGGTTGADVDVRGDPLEGRLADGPLTSNVGARHVYVGCGRLRQEFGKSLKEYGPFGLVIIMTGIDYLGVSAHPVTTTARRLDVVLYLSPGLEFGPCFFPAAPEQWVASGAFRDAICTRHDGRISR